MENHSRVEISNTALKIDKDDIRAKRHFVRSSMKDGKEIKIWECGLCAKQFKFQYTLVRHIPTHTDVRNYRCNVCPKAFRQLSTLAQHKVTHLNLRPFVCEYCSKSFNRISTLISHKKIHFDIKRHICDFCGKGFHQKGNLRNHMYTHTNERPYKCDLCYKGFNQKSNLVCHKVSTHLKKMYYCDLCELQFTKEVSYSSHMCGIHGTIICKSEDMVNTPSIQPVTGGKRKSNVVLKLPSVYANVWNNNNEGECVIDNISETCSIELERSSGLLRRTSEFPTITPIPKSENETRFSQYGSNQAKSPLTLGNLSRELKNPTAVVYTKTQPNVRAKPRVNVPSVENKFIDQNGLFHAKCLECSSRALTVDSSMFQSNSDLHLLTKQRGIPSGFSSLPSISIVPNPTSQPFIEPFCKDYEENYRILRKPDIDDSKSSSKIIHIECVNPSKLISGSTSSSCQDVAKDQEDPINNNDDESSESFGSKTDLSNEVPSQTPALDVVGDIESSLFSSPDTLKDSFKFCLDFESNFDFLEEAFESGLLDNVNMTSNAAEASNAYSQTKFDEGLSFIDL